MLGHKKCEKGSQYNAVSDGEDGANPSRCRHCKRGVLCHIRHWLERALSCSARRAMHRGRRRETTIRESGDPADGTLNTLRVKGRFHVVVCLTFALVGCCCVFVPCFARPWRRRRNGRSEVIETREVVVSATKTAIPVKQVTSAVEVITGEQMQQRKVKNRRRGTALGSGTCRVSKRRAGHCCRRADARRNAGTDARLDRWGDRQQCHARVPTTLRI